MAQEFATDRLFMKEYYKTECRNSAERIIKKLKSKRTITLEQENLLNQNIWSKLRLKLPLSPGEKLRLKYLKGNNLKLDRLSKKEIWKEQAKRFKKIRHQCK